MTDELKMVFKEIIYHIDDIGFQTEWLTKTLRKVDTRSRRTKFLLLSTIAAGIGYVFKNEQDKKKLKQEIANLKCKSDTIEEGSDF